MSAVLLDSSFLIDLEREIASGSAGPAMAWLRRNRGSAKRALLVSCVSVAEFMEGFRTAGEIKDGLAFLDRYVPQNIGFKTATKCAEIQRRALQKGHKYGENDAWQLAIAERSEASIVGRDRNAFLRLGKRYEQHRLD